MNSQKRWMFALTAMAVSLLIIVGLIVFTQSAGRHQLSGRARPNSEHYNVSQSHHKAAAPDEQAGIGTRDIPSSREAAGVASGLDAAKVTTVLQIGTSEDFPDYDRESLTVKPGEIVELRFSNNSLPRYNYLFNWVLTNPGRKGQVANEAVRAGVAQEFIPDSPDVLAHTHLLRAGETDTIIFKAPDQAGDYPFICTFPGQANQMNGVLHVKS